MKTIPKPTYCGQNWLAMQPISGGRICGQCNKKIVDFTKMSWAEIESIQHQQNNTICGIYNAKQLANWEQEIPVSNKSFLNAITVTGLSFSILVNSYAQSQVLVDSILIKGTVYQDETSNVVPFATLFLRDAKVGTTADINGNFELVVKRNHSSPFSDTLDILSVGFMHKQIVLKQDNLNENLKVELSLGHSTNFYVHSPTTAQRIKWTIQKWFRRKKK